MSDSVFEYSGFSIPVNLVEMTGGGPETFDAISRNHIDCLRVYIGLWEGMSVLEIGCGIGRDAIPLTEIIGPNGTYVGTDVIEPSIAWCQANISSRHPNFSFEWHDIYDDLHNPAGKILAEDVRIPCADESIDIVILQSVFTHMYEHEIRHYMKEFQRVLKQDGKVWASVFVVDKGLLDAVRETAPTIHALAFKYPYGDGCYINSLGSPRGAVAFTRAAFDRMVKYAKLELIREPLVGAWSGTREKAEFGQDVLLLRNAGTIEPATLLQPDASEVANIGSGLAAE